MFQLLPENDIHTKVNLKNSHLTLPLSSQIQAKEGDGIIKIIVAHTVMKYTPDWIVTCSESTKIKKRCKKLPPCQKKMSSG